MTERMGLDHMQQHPTERLSNNWSQGFTHDDVPVVASVNDLRIHQGGIGCWCGAMWVDDGNGGVVVVHNSLDRREDYDNKILRRH